MDDSLLRAGPVQHVHAPVRSEPRRHSPGRAPFSGKREREPQRGRTRATPPGDHRIGTDGESDSVFQHANTKIRLQIATLAQYGGWDLIQLLVFQQRIEPSLAASQRQLALEHDAQLSPE